MDEARKERGERERREKWNWGKLSLTWEYWIMERYNYFLK